MEMDEAEPQNCAAAAPAPPPHLLTVDAAAVAASSEAAAAPPQVGAGALVALPACRVLSARTWPELGLHVRAHAARGQHHHRVCGWSFRYVQAAGPRRPKGDMRAAAGRRRW